MANKKHLPKAEFRPYNRMETTIAEIMRCNYPLSVSSDEGLTWLDIVEDLAKMFGTKDSRFDSDGFYERCFGAEWEPDMRKRPEVIDIPEDEMHIGV